MRYEEDYEYLVKAGIISRGRHRKGASYGPHGLWYEQDGRENYTKYDRPYSYSPFFNFGDHESIKDAECCYSDRYYSWGSEKLEAACKKAGIKGPNNMTQAQANAFVKAYHGKEYECVGQVEWCNVSNGYPCWSIHFKRAEGAASPA